MAVIKIANFGGVAPSVDPRKLGPGLAQTAENLDLRFGDFRPIKGAGASVTTVPSSTLSVHRAPSGAWLTSTADANFVNGQINEAAVERVYLTGRSAYPEVWTSPSTFRRLGVPAPAAAPTLVKNVTDEYTYEEQRTSVTKWVQDVRTAVLANITSALIANGTPATGALGAVWLAHGAVAGMPTTLDSQIVYAVPMTGGSATTASDQYLLDPLLGGKQITYSSNPYWAVPMMWRPYGYTVNQSALSTAIKAFTKPPANTEQLVPNEVADQIAQRIANIANTGLQPLSTLIPRVNAAQADVATILLRNLTDTARVYALADALQKLATAIQNVDAWFSGFETPMLAVLEDYNYLVPAYVDRVVETRFYLYTYVTDRGEESSPSPASVAVEPDQNDTVTVTASAPAGGGSYGTISSWRLYRSATTSSGAAWQLVDANDLPIGTLTYTDTKKQSELQPDVLPTQTWAEPRAEMVGLTGGANGVMLGFAGQTLCACEPYAPYAWPREYELSVAHKIVALAPVGQSWIVLTEGDTYLVSGADSASLSIQKLPNPQSCVSKRSVAPVAGGVLFASPDGVCLADTSGVRVLTTGAYTLDDWRALTPSASFGAFSEGIYYLWLTTAGKLITMDFAKTALSVSAASGVTAAYTDLLTDVLYAASGTTLLPMLQGSAQTGDWKSGIYAFDEQPSFAWARADGAFTAATLRLYGDDMATPVHTVTLQAKKPVRLPAKRAREWVVRLSGTERVTDLVIASTNAELTK